jgi:hypothetical protein
LRGAVTQLAFVIGLVAGLWAASWVSQWVGAHWHGARPAVVFWTLRWLVAVLAGMSLLAVAQWSGERIREALKDGPFGWFDHLLGVAAGAALGALVVALLLLSTVRLTSRGDVTAAFAASRFPSLVMEQAEKACARWGRVLPAGPWLHQEFTLASHRLHGARSGGPASGSPGSPH